jgi:molybdate transport system substrate-binding protein
MNRLVAACAALALPLGAAAQQVTVCAAASLTDGFKDLGRRFEASRPGVTVRFNFAASGVLLQQIRQGAPADVFASADQETMDRAVAQKLVDAASRRNFAANTLVLVEPARGGAGIQALPDLSGAGVRKIAIGKPATVPVGRYTKEALDSARLWATLEPKFVHADNARQALDYVARGEVEAGFVYRTDAALMGDRVRVVRAATGHSPIAYPVAIVADSRQQALARDFLAFLASDAGQQVLAKYGFGRP